MKLLDKVGDALLTKLVPGIDAKANCGMCRHNPTPFTCTPRCCRGGHQFSAVVVTDLCGRACYSCKWGLKCHARC